MVGAVHRARVVVWVAVSTVVHLLHELEDVDETVAHAASMSQKRQADITRGSCTNGRKTTRRPTTPSEPSAEGSGPRFLARILARAGLALFYAVALPAVRLEASMLSLRSMLGSDQRGGVLHGRVGAVRDARFICGGFCSHIIALHFVLECRHELGRNAAG